MAYILGEDRKPLVEVTPLSSELEKRVKEVEGKDEMNSQEAQAQFLKARLHVSFTTLMEGWISFKTC